MMPPFDSAVPGASGSHHDVENSGRRIAVIGAGVAGVATAAALSAYDIKDFVVYDRNTSVGGLWTNNYPGAGGKLIYKATGFES